MRSQARAIRRVPGHGSCGTGEADVAGQPPPSHAAVVRPFLRAIHGTPGAGCPVIPCLAGGVLCVEGASPAFSGDLAGPSLSASSLLVSACRFVSV